MRLPDESISFQNTTGDSGVENLFVYGKLNYNFDNDDIKARSINISGDITGSSFSGSGANLTNLPAGNLTGILPAISGANLTGIEAFVQGMIILWYGNTGNVPNGFVLCDGNNGTPDLRGKFVAGAGNPDYTPGSTGGAETVTLTEAEIPSHKHTTNIDGGHVIPGNGGSSFPYGGAGTYSSTVFSMSNTGGGGAHENRPPYHALCYIMKT